MSVRFEKVSRFQDVDLPLPTRSTVNSAGYDFTVAEDIILPPIEYYIAKIRDAHDAPDYFGFMKPLDLPTVAELTKNLKAKIPLVSTGMKCYLEPNQYLEISMRSSTPLKHWLILGNGVGIIDADYVDSPDGEGEIFFQVINLGPYAVELKRGDRIGQGIIKTYEKTDDDCTEGERVGGLGSTNN